MYILTTTDYFTKWVEVTPTFRATSKVVIDFIETNIYSHFGILVSLVIDNTNFFYYIDMVNHSLEYNI